jgi:hypothetical protein
MEKINFVNGSAPALNATNLNQLQKNIEEALLAMKPVGSIEINTTGVNPSEYIGGTWEAWGSGRVPVGVDTVQTEFNTVEKTGGEKEHTLTVKEMPSHSHSTVHKVGAGDGDVTGYQWANNVADYGAVATTSTGGGQPHNNLQPYITCYMWKRTA